MKNRISVLLLLLTFFSSVLCTSPPSFCKCTCFTNSTIIPLDTPPSLDKSPSSYLSHLGLRAPTTKDKRTCTDCNRQFCLDYNLPICKDVKADTDVVATCFQRDSVKDEVVVFLFIGATVGLLGWAVVKPWVEGWVEKIKGGHTYDALAR